MSFIKSINKKEDSILLELYLGEDIQVNNDNALDNIDKSSNNIRISVLDVETTGFDLETNEIIEVAIKTIECNKNDGSNITAVKKYESYNDPGIDIDPEITSLTGISNDMVKDKSINWDDVKEILDSSQLIIAHNARFDRKFIEKYITTNNIWACSQNDINWKERGFFKQSLEMLCIWHGFYYGAHRAMNDVNATIHLIKHPSYIENKPLVELIANAKKPHYKIENKFPYNEEHIKLIKERRYRYNPNNKSWNITLNDEEKINEEKNWLTDNIYNGTFKGIIIMITVFDKYKDND